MVSTNTILKTNYIFTIDFLFFYTLMKSIELFPIFANFIMCWKLIYGIRYFHQLQT